jgi:hypothetical protein
MKGNGLSPLVRADGGSEQGEGAGNIDAPSKAEKKGDKAQMEVGPDERQTDEGADENPKAKGNGSFEAHSWGEPSGYEKGACITYGEEKEGASG